MMRKIFPYLFLLSLAFSPACSLLKPAAEKDRDDGPDEKAAIEARALFHDANRERILGNYSEAEKLFRQVLEREPANAAAHYELARVFRKLDKVPEALAMVEKAVQLDGNNQWYTLFLAELYEATGQVEKAIALLEELVVQHPADEDFRRMLTEAYLLTGKPQQAMKVLEGMERDFGPDEEIILQKKELWQHLGKFAKAVEEMEKLMRLNPASTRYMAILAEMYMQEEEYDKAFSYYRRIQEADPGDPYIHMALADYYRKTGDNAASFQELQLGFANPRLDVDTKVKILMSFYAVGEVFEEMRSQGLELATTLVAAHPEDPKSHSVRADFLSREERYAEAAEALKRVISLDSSKYIVWEQLLRIQFELTDFEQMQNYAGRALNLFPSMPLPYLFKGIAAYQLKKYETAAETFSMGSLLVVDNPDLRRDFYTYAGDTYQQLKDYPNSSKYYEKVLKEDPDNVYVLNNYSYFLSLRKDKLEKAAEMALRANTLDPDNASFQDTYGWVLYQQGKYDEAKVWLEKALENGGNENDVILEHYGDVLYQLSEKEKALLFWQRASEAGSGSEFLPQKIRDEKLYE